VQSNGAIAARRTQSGIDWPALIAEIFDQLESQLVAVEVHPALHVFHVDHGMVEGELSFVG